jgi:hypothetical protein
MNERIKQLAIQAGAEHFTGKNAHLPIGRLDKEGIEKFVELIIKECCNILDPGEHQLIARFQARKMLEENFGV